MKKVKSSDGTLIAYEKTGKGPPMVLVHGTVVDHTHWDMVLPKLAKYFTVYAIDRRGRGKSGDGADYKAEFEFDDVAAVVKMMDEPVILLGQSYGGFIVLEAALRTENIGKLILEKVAGFPSGEIDKYRQAPLWNVMVSAAHTLPRELKAETEYKFESSRFKDLNIPTMLLTGSESISSDKEGVKVLNKTLPENIIITLKGQGHDGFVTAPGLFADKVIKFARE